MSAEPIYLVTDAGSPVTAFTTKQEMKAYLKRKRDTFSQRAMSSVSIRGTSDA
jgi:hypothetical protein